jgi:hypothetical protein
MRSSLTARLHPSATQQHSITSSDCVWQPACATEMERSASARMAGMFTHGCFAGPLCCALEVLKGKHASVLCRQALTSIPRAAAEALQAPVAQGHRRKRSLHMPRIRSAIDFAFTLPFTPATCPPKSGSCETRERQQQAQQWSGVLATQT